MNQVMRSLSRNRCRPFHGLRDRYIVLGFRFALPQALCCRLLRRLKDKTEVYRTEQSVLNEQSKRTQY